MPLRTEQPPKDREPKHRRRLYESFRDAFRGVWRCLESERNMRIHMAACGYVAFFALKMGVSRGELACLFLAMGAVTCAEALNTSVEKLCDYVENRHNRQIGLVKDLAAGGVVLSAVFAALAGVAVLLRPELWTVVCDIAGTPWKLLVFLGTVFVSLWVIFVVPLKK